MTTAGTESGESRGQGVLGGVARKLLNEAGQYVEAKGERLIADAGDRVSGMVDRTLGGSPGGEAAKEAVKTMVSGGSPTKSIFAGAAGAVKSLFTRGKGRGGRKSTNIIEDIDVGVPVSVAYNQWTQFQEFASFMKGVEGVDQSDEVQSDWRLKIGPSRRSWKADIDEQIPDRRIAWHSQGAKGSTKGAVTFHPLADDLTKVIVVMEYTAVGPFEKVGNMMRLQLRRVRLDLREFKKFITMRNEETGAWRGEIRDGEVVNEGDEESGRQQPEDSEPERSEDGQQPQPAAEESAEESNDDEEPDEDSDREPEPAGNGGASRRRRGR